MNNGMHIDYEELLRQEHYRPDDLAALLDINVDLIQHAVYAGELRALVLDHHVVDIRRADALQWLAERYEGRR